MIQILHQHANDHVMWREKRKNQPFFFFASVIEFMLLCRRALGEKKHSKLLLNALMEDFFALQTEYPVFVKEPPSHISAEMEKVVDIPCQARGECFFPPCVLLHV